MYSDDELTEPAQLKEEIIQITAASDRDLEFQVVGRLGTYRLELDPDVSPPVLRLARVDTPNA